MTQSSNTDSVVHVLPAVVTVTADVVVMVTVDTVVMATADVVVMVTGDAVVMVTADVDGTEASAAAMPASRRLRMKPTQTIFHRVPSDETKTNVRLAKFTQYFTPSPKTLLIN